MEKGNVWACCKESEIKRLCCYSSVFPLHLKGTGFDFLYVKRDQNWAYRAALKSAEKELQCRGCELGDLWGKKSEKLLF